MCAARTRCDDGEQSQRSCAHDPDVIGRGAAHPAQTLEHGHRGFDQYRDRTERAWHRSADALRDANELCRGSWHVATHAHLRPEQAQIAPLAPAHHAPAAGDEGIADHDISDPQRLHVIRGGEDRTHPFVTRDERQSSVSPRQVRMATDVQLAVGSAQSDVLGTNQHGRRLRHGDGLVNDFDAARPGDGDGPDSRCWPLACRGAQRTCRTVAAGSTRMPKPGASLRVICPSIAFGSPEKIR